MSATTQFKIETEKWSWAEAVQRKEIYRDDQFIRSKSKEEALEAAGFLLEKPVGGYNYTITVLRNNEYLTYWRHPMPCMGGLVKYKDSHGDRYYMNPYFPRDIYVAFPEGEIIYIGYALKSRNFDNSRDEFMLSQESPWVSGFGAKDRIVFGKGYIILTDMNTDPTVFYHWLRWGYFTMNPTTYKDFDPRAQILISQYQQSDPRRIAGQKPIRISGGTWAEGYGYTRPYNESIFKTSIPKKLEEFSKGSTGYGNWNSSYFTFTMKDKFGITVPTYGAIFKKDKHEKALVEAWEYFKGESKKLGDEPGKAYE